MGKKKALIIVSAIEDRKPLMRRSMETWKREIRSVADTVDFQVRIYSEGWDAAEEVSEPDWKTASGERTGTCMTGYAHWSTEPADYYLYTGPEFLFGTGLLSEMLSTVHKNVYVSARSFWVPQYMTVRLDEFDWRNPESLEQVEALYVYDDLIHGNFYSNIGIRNINQYENNACWMMDAETHARMLPWPKFTQWGQPDTYMYLLRRKLGIETRTIKGAAVYHQWHPKYQADVPIEEYSAAVYQAINSHHGGTQ